MIYAFDVSTIHTDTSSPRLLWKAGCPNLGDDTGCTTGFSDIGQTIAHHLGVKPLSNGTNLI